MLAQKLFRTFPQFVYNNLINFLLKKQNLKYLIEIWLAILIIGFYRDCSLYHSLLYGNYFQLFQVCQFYLILTWYLDWKTASSCRQFFLIPQSYTWRGNLHVEIPVLQPEMCWFILILNLFVLSPTVFPIHVSFSLRIFHSKMTKWQSISLQISQTWSLTL